MPDEARMPARAGPEPSTDAGRSHAIDHAPRHAPQPTRRRPRSTHPARKDENPPEAIRHPARNDPPREPKMHDGRLRQSTRHRSAEAITVSGLTLELSRLAKQGRLERLVRHQRPGCLPAGTDRLDQSTAGPTPTRECPRKAMRAAPQSQLCGAAPHRFSSMFSCRMAVG